MRAKLEMLVKEAMEQYNNKIKEKEREKFSSNFLGVSAKIIIFTRALNQNNYDTLKINPL